MLTFGYIWDILMVNVTIYSSTMDPMGNGISMRMVASGNPKPLATDCRAADNNDGNERSPSKMEPIYIYGWWLTYPSKKQKSVGIIIPNIWTKKKCSKPPTSYGMLFGDYWPKLILGYLDICRTSINNMGHVFKRMGLCGHIFRQSGMSISRW
jgi:hypothetical protein